MQKYTKLKGEKPFRVDYYLNSILRNFETSDCDIIQMLIQ